MAEKAVPPNAPERAPPSLKVGAPSTTLVPASEASKPPPGATPMEIEAESIHGAEATAVGAEVATTATGVVPPENLKEGGAPSTVQEMSGGGEGEGKGTGKGKGKGKGSAEEGKGSAEVHVASLGKHGAGALEVPAGPAAEKYNWMPSLRESKPSRECMRRVRKDIRTLMRDPVHGLFVCPDEDLVTVVHALITGPFDTPYEGGFFYFVLHCPDDYPHSPPKVRLMTTGGGTVRFNPNLYANGKVCLSILGTWSGPRWTPVHSISSVLLSIQSLMSAKPYHNEPGFEAASNPRDVRDYSDCITHENLRVAVCSMVDDSSLWRSMPGCFQGLTRDLFLSFVPRYELLCEQNMSRDGQKMVDPFGQNRGVFRYGAILHSIRKIAAMITSVAEGDGQGTDAHVAAEGGRDEGGESTQHAATTTTAATTAATDTSAGASGSGVSLPPNKTEQGKMTPVGPVAANRSEAGGADGGQDVVGAGKGGAVSGSHVSSPTR